MTYGISAYNLDTKFPEKWSMDEYAIPVNYYNTKVNVASCESANNALNQEWYNRHQPYKTQKRLQQRTDGKIARDTMQFQNGVVFIKDTNKNTNNSSATANNVFKEIPGYVDNPYPRMYSVGNMGNSKKNIEVFHGAGNNYECCVEVADNNTDAQRMIIIPGFYPSGEINVNGENIKVEGHEISLDLPDEMFDQDGFVIANADWGKTLDPYLQALGIPEEQCYVDNAAMWKNSLIGEEYFEFRYCVDEDDFSNNKVSQEFNSFTEYQQDLSNRFLRLLRWFALNNPSQATNNPLPSPIKFEDYTIKGVKATTNYTNYNSSDEVLKGTVIAGGEYTNDTAEYRVAKMLRESENYLILDSVLYHYIFIERHTMVDNVAKNTFWNTEDGKHWELTKNYDNDTSDGVDNSGHLIYNYGIEIMDNDEKGSHIFNARPSAWLHFAHGLKPLREKMYQYLNAKTGENDWKADAYLKLFENWQKVIPEICWIEDFNRKYFRPNNVYGDKSYLARLANGKKTHQRKQYETYQEQYTSSEYKTSATEGSLIQWRSKQPDKAITEEGKYEIKGKVKLYASGYLTIAIASGAGEAAAINIHIRGKKGEEIEFSKIQGSSFGDATCYIYTPNLYQEFTGIETLYPSYFTATDAKKLRKISLIPQTQYQKVTLSDSLSFGTNVEEIIINDCINANFELDLTSCSRLKILNTVGSAFTGYSIADGAPLTEFVINTPTSLVLSNLYYLTNFNIKDYNQLGKIEINNIDYNNINSINIIEETKKLNKNIEYILTNVNWTFDSNDGITDTSIPILDYLMTKGLTINNRKKEESLLGIANIPNSAYSGANALTLYNKYGLKSENDSSYPNLTLNFLNDNGTKKLYTVTIMNGDGEKKWSRQYANFNSISNSDLTQSSLGALNFAETVKKQDTSNTVYTFAEKWICKINNKEYEIKGADSNSFYLDLSQLKTIIETESGMQDVIIEPFFEESIKYYTVSFRNRETGEEFYKINNIQHNASFEEVRPPQVPIKDDSSLALTQTYRLKCYTTSKTGSNPSLTIEETWRLKDNTIFYPVFEEANVYDIDYREYLNIGEETRTIDGIKKACKVLYGIKQKSGDDIYQGNKIVIPAEIEIIGNNAFSSTSIKYIFIENGSALFQIDQQSFTTSMLKYFDFENCTNLKTISTEAFKTTKLDGQYYTDGVIKLPDGLKSIGNSAFNDTISSSTEIKFYIPASVSFMGQYAVANWDGAKAPCTIYIGEEEDFSQLEFNYSPTIKFNTSGKPPAVYVNFYTQRYTKEEIEENEYIFQITDLSVINS